MNLKQLCLGLNRCSVRVSVCYLLEYSMLGTTIKVRTFWLSESHLSVGPWFRASWEDFLTETTVET